MEPPGWKGTIVIPHPFLLKEQPPSLSAKYQRLMSGGACARAVADGNGHVACGNRRIPTGEYAGNVRFAHSIHLNKLSDRPFFQLTSELNG